MAHRDYGFLMRYAPAAAKGSLPDLAVAMFEAWYVAPGYITAPSNNYWTPELLVTQAGSIHDYRSGRLPAEFITRATAKAGLAPWDSTILHLCEGVASVINWYVNFQPNIRGAEAPGPFRTLVEPPTDFADIKRMIDDIFERLPAEIAAIYDSTREAPMHPAWRARLWRARTLAEILWDFTYAVHGRAGPLLKGRKAFLALIDRVKGGGASVVAAYDQSRAFRNTSDALDFYALME